MNKMIVDIIVLGVKMITSFSRIGVGRYLKEQNKDIQVFLADPQGSVLYHWKREGKLEPLAGIGRNPTTISEDIDQRRMTKNFESSPIDEALPIKNDLVIEYVGEIFALESNCSDQITVPTRFSSCT